MSATGQIREALAAEEYGRATHLWNEYVEQVRRQIEHGTCTPAVLAETAELLQWSRGVVLCDQARAQARRPQELRLFDAGERSDPRAADPHHSVELWPSLRAALDSLTVQQRTVLVLRYFGDRSEAEVAGLLGISTGTVKSTASRAIAHLRGFPGLAAIFTTTDSSLTRPWTVMKTYKRQETVFWAEDNCPEGQAHVTIGNEVYFQSGDGTISISGSATRRSRASNAGRTKA